MSKNLWLKAKFS